MENYNNIRFQDKRKLRVAYMTVLASIFRMHDRSRLRKLACVFKAKDCSHASPYLEVTKLKVFSDCVHGRVKCICLCCGLIYFVCF